MDPSSREKIVHLLQGIARLFFAGAGLAFLFGGGLIHAISPGTDRILSEIGGAALAALCVVLGFLAKVAEDRLGAGDVDAHGPKSLNEALRK
jgi:hypothetical protein